MIRFLNNISYIRKRNVLPWGIPEAERAEKYFFYELDKAKYFVQKHEINVANKVVLEIGCGYGGNLQYFLNLGAAYIYGIEYDKTRFKYCKNILMEKVNNKNFRILNLDARFMKGLENNYFDIIVSDATIEHILDLYKVFDEIYRVLKTGGYAYISTSPIWFTRNGGHLKRYIPIPWIHLIFPDKIILGILKLQKKNKDFPKYAIENIIDIYENAGKLSLKKLRNLIKNSDLTLVKFNNYTKSKIKKLLIKLPYVKEFFSGNISIVLKKE